MLNERIDIELKHLVESLWFFVQSLEESEEPSEVILEFELPENLELENSLIKKIEKDPYLREHLEGIKRLQETDLLKNLAEIYWRDESNEKDKEKLEKLLRFILIFKIEYSKKTAETENSGETQDMKKLMDWLKYLCKCAVKLYFNKPDFDITEFSRFGQFWNRALQLTKSATLLSSKQKTEIWKYAFSKLQNIQKSKKDSDYLSKLLLTLKQVNQITSESEYLGNIQEAILEILASTFEYQLQNPKIQPIAKRISKNFNTPMITPETSIQIKENQLIVNIEVNSQKHTIQLELNLDELSGQDMVSILTKIINIYTRFLIIFNTQINITLKNITSIDDFFKKLTEAIAPIAFKFDDHATKHFIAEKKVMK
jgi:hypothetical protein